jgi:hypothetical protein
LFLPIAGIPAMIVWVGLQFLYIALLPVRLLGWLTRRTVTGRTVTKAG